MVLRISPLIGRPALMAHGVIRVPNFTSNGVPIDEKRKRAFFNCLADLYSKANSVLSKEIAGYDFIDEQ